MERRFEPLFLTSPRLVEITQPTMAVRVPRRRGLLIAWAILAATISAYLHRDPAISFDVGED